MVLERASRLPAFNKAVAAMISLEGNRIAFAAVIADEIIAVAGIADDRMRRGQINQWHIVLPWAALRMEEVIQ